MGSESADLQKLGPNHLRAVALVAMGKTSREVAAEVGVCVQTVYKWRTAPLFKRALADRMRDLEEVWMEDARASWGEAFRVLRDLATDPKQPPAVRRQAASDILDRVGPVRRSQSDQHHSGSGVTITLAGPDGATPDADALEALEDALERELAMGGDEDP